MATGTDFKHLWDRYQREGVPRQISIVRFCQMNGVVYGHFEKWYKQRHGGVIPVEIVSSGVEPEEEKAVRLENPGDEPGDQVRVRRLEIVFSSGLVVHHNNLDYAGLRVLVEKLASLC